MGEVLHRIGGIEAIEVEALHHGPGEGDGEDGLFGGATGAGVEEVGKGGDEDGIDGEQGKDLATDTKDRATNVVLVDLVEPGLGHGLGGEFAGAGKRFDLGRDGLLRVGLEEGFDEGGRVNAVGEGGTEIGEFGEGGEFAQDAAVGVSITAQDGARLPNARRAANQKRLAKEGMPIDRALHDRLQSFAEGKRG